MSRRGAETAESLATESLRWRRHAVALIADRLNRDIVVDVGDENG
jgi:hypothetical protein